MELQIPLRGTRDLTKQIYQAMRAGKLVTTLDAEHLTEEELIAHATGTAP